MFYGNFVLISFLIRKLYELEFCVNFLLKNYLILFPLVLFVSSRIDLGARIFTKDWKLEKGILSNKGANKKL